MRESKPESVVKSSENISIQERITPFASYLQFIARIFRAGGTDWIAQVARHGTHLNAGFQNSHIV
jgi:hypothetical protein